MKVEINLGGASFNTEHILSFNSEKEFVDRYMNEIYADKSEKEQSSILKSIYKNAKKIEKDLKED